MIPQKVKTQKVMDTGGGLEKAVIVLIVLMFCDTVISPRVHSSLSPLMYFMIVIITLYLIMPNKKNYGSSGCTRLVLALKYQINKWKERVVKKS